MKRILRRLLIVLLVLVAAIQLVPYGRTHDNPPVTGEPPWDAPATRVLAKRACFDCHSHETVWPWYAWIAPISWLVQHDVDEGREHLNFSAWDRPQKHADDAAEELEEGSMPLRPYLLLHAQARLDAAEKAALLRGLRATLGSEDEHDE